VVPVKGEAIILNDLVGFFIEKGVAIYKRPEKLLVVESMPKNSLGKILKRELRKRVVQ
jgi:non-ribosomal peptide synthetase component E (peptide arylation enzyme)